MAVEDEADPLHKQEHQGQSSKHRHSWSCLPPTPTQDCHPQGYHHWPMLLKQMHVLTHCRQPILEAMHTMRSHYLKMTVATSAHGRSGLKQSLIYVTYGQSLTGHCQGQTTWHPSWTAQSGHPRIGRPGP